MKLVHVCLIFGLSILLAGCRIKQQNKTPVAAQQSTQADSRKDDIDRINNFVHSVSDHEHSFTIKKSILGTDDGGQLIGYYDRQVLTKIDVWLGMSNNAFSQQFYFKNGHLIFANETRKYYSWDQSKGKLNRNQFSKTKIETYYFQNGILIQHIPDEKRNAAEPDVLSYARMYIKFLSMKENTVYVNQ